MTQQNGKAKAVRQLSQAKAARAPPLRRRSAEYAFSARWWALLSVAVQRSICAAILRPAGADLLPAKGDLGEVVLADVLDFNR